MDARPETPPQHPDTRAAHYRVVRACVLITLGAAALAALAAISSSGHRPGGAIAIWWAATIAIALGLVYLHFRHWGLALSVALAPVPAVAGAVLFATQGPAPAEMSIVIAYLLGFAAALALADGFADEIVEGARVDRAIRADWRSQAPAITAILAMAAVLPAIFAVAGSTAERSATLLSVWANAASILCALLTVPLAASFFSFGEEFISDTNRLREDWNRRLERVIAVAQPRWSWSAAGILAVFVALAVFGGQSLRATPNSKLNEGILAAAGFVILLAAAAIAAGSWRRAIALAIAAVSGLLLCCWGFARAGAILDARLLALALDMLALLFAPLAILAGSAAHAVRAGDDTAEASAHALTRKGPIALLLSLGGLVLLAPWYRELDRASLGVAFALLFAAAAAVLFLPALTGVIEALIPRRRGMAERYRIK